MKERRVPEIENLGKILIVLGGVILITGLIVLLASRLPGIDKLPGAILIHRDGVTIYFPIVACLILSIILTIVLNLIARFFR